jgi:hypothetical protein
MVPAPTTPIDRMADMMLDSLLSLDRECNAIASTEA